MHVITHLLLSKFFSVNFKAFFFFKYHMTDNDDTMLWRQPNPKNFNYTFLREKNGDVL